MQHIINETQSFSYIKFNGQTILNYAINSADAKIALKELRILKKLINADKKNVNNQLRDIRSRSQGIKSVMSVPSRGRWLGYLRWGTRLAAASETQPLEQWKTFYNDLLLLCDRIQLQLEKL